MEGCPRPGRGKAEMTVPLRQQQQVGERQALDICTSPASFHQLPAKRQGRGRAGITGESLSLEER